MMPKGNFSDCLAEAICQKNSLLCVGLDPQLKDIPPFIRKRAVEEYGTTRQAIFYAFTLFFEELIEKIAPFAACVKPNIAFFEQYGSEGLRAYEAVLDMAKGHNLLVIGDVKRGDGGDTAIAYANAHLSNPPMLNENGELIAKASSLQVDAITVHGWIAEAGLTPFIDGVKYQGNGIFVVCKTSFKPNSRIEQLKTEHGTPVWQELAKIVQELGTGTEGECGYRNVGVVIGATYPEDAPTMRDILPNAWFLVPGYGAQGGGADSAVIGANKDGLGIIINSSRGVLYAYKETSGQFKGKEEDFASCAAQAAEFARDDLNAALQRAGKGR